MRIYPYLALSLSLLALLSACTSLGPTPAADAAATVVTPAETASPTPVGTPTVTPEATASMDARTALTTTSDLTETESTTSVIMPLSTAVLTPTSALTTTSQTETQAEPPQSNTTPAAAATPITATSAMTTSGSLLPTATAGPDPLADTSDMTIGEILQSVGDFSVLAAAVNEAALTEALNGPGPYTLFAPTDEAFAVLPPAIRETLLADPALLNDILRYHLVVDNADAARLTELGGAPALSAQPLTITVAANGDLQVNDAVIVRRDVSASNGMIHVINRLLTPPDVALAIPAAPTAAITLADGLTATTALDALATSDTSGQTILEILRSTEGLSVAAAAVDSAGLSEALTEAGPFTLLIPTDSAFGALGEAVTSTLNNTQASADLVQTHLIADHVTAAQLVALGAVLTANGQTLDITVGAEDGQIFVNGAPVSQVDIEASNGMIHILSAVIPVAP